MLWAKSDSELINPQHTQKLPFPHSPGLMAPCIGQRSRAESVNPVLDACFLLPPSQGMSLEQFEPLHVGKVTEGVQISPPWHGLS